MGGGEGERGEYGQARLPTADRVAVRRFKVGGDDAEAFGISGPLEEFGVQFCPRLSVPALGVATHHPTEDSRGEPRTATRTHAAVGAVRTSASSAGEGAWYAQSRRRGHVEQRAPAPR